MADGATGAQQAAAPAARKHGFFVRNQAAFRAWTATISSAAQVVAVVIAGIWAYRNFSQSEKPALEPHLSTSADVTWGHLPDEKSCAANVVFSLENNGKAPVEVTGARIRGWIARIPTAGSLTRPRVYTDEEVAKTGELFFDAPAPTRYLLGHFPPGVKSEDVVTFLFKNQPGKAAMWEIEYTTSEHLKYPAKALIYDSVCNYESK